MAKVAIDISPTITGHKTRGVGSYTRYLVDELKKAKWPIEFEFFPKPASPPPASLVHHPYFDLFFHTLPIYKTAARGVTIHDVIPLVFPKHFPVGLRGRFAHFLQKKALKNTDFIICDSQTSKRDIIAKLGVDPEIIKVIYLAAGDNFKKVTDTSILESVREKLKLPQKFVLYVGDVNWHKNVGGLIAAIAQIKIPLVLVGSAFVDPGLKEAQMIDWQVGRNNLSSLITKTGFLSETDLIAVYNLAAVTVLPSFYEGFGLPVLESMACGTPAVCSNIVALSEIAQNAAIYCDPNSPTDIAQKIDYTLSLSQPEKEKLQEKSQTATRRFSWSKTAQKTVEVYQKYLRD